METTKTIRTIKGNKGLLYQLKYLGWEVVKVPSKNIHKLMNKMKGINEETLRKTCGSSPNVSLTYSEEEWFKVYKEEYAPLVERTTKNNLIVTTILTIMELYSSIHFLVNYITILNLHDLAMYEEILIKFRELFYIEVTIFLLSVFIEITYKKIVFKHQQDQLKEIEDKLEFIATKSNNEFYCPEESCVE